MAIICLFGSGDAHANWIGIFTTETPNPNCADARYDGALPGQFTVYAVLFATVDGADQPVTEICGYEFALILPPDFLIINEVLPPGVDNGGVSPVYDCSGTVPVTDGRANLVTITLATFTGTSGLLYLEPVPEPEIPGTLTICAGNPAHTVEAAPVSGNFAEPVFGIAMDYPFCIVPETQRTWSTIKALYR
ncbi:MAG: hypothetical protein GY838_17195 [bacterium]|nr:hypothetical protein [bacterium]